MDGNGPASLGPGELEELSKNDSPIYRIYPKGRFLEMLRIWKDALVNPGLWDDPYENFLLASTKVRLSGELNGQFGSLVNLATRCYGQCWSRTEESDAMWRIYSPCKDGIKVRSSCRNIFDNFSKHLRKSYFGEGSDGGLGGLCAEGPDKAVGRTQICSGWNVKIYAVIYHTQNEIFERMEPLTLREMTLGGDPSLMLEALCVKREAFRHENEVRLVYWAHQREKEGRIIQFDLNPNEVFEEAVLDPRNSEEEGNGLTEELRDCGLTIPIRRSTLYDPPDFTIPVQRPT